MRNAAEAFILVESFAGFRDVRLDEGVVVSSVVHRVAAVDVSKSVLAIDNLV